MRLSPLKSLYDATLGVRACEVTVPSPCHALAVARVGTVPLPPVPRS